MSDELPWPKPDSSLFTIKHNGHYSANLKWAQGRSYGYTEGYRRAANLVFAHVAERGTSLDMLVLPLVYLWRHGIELQLKLIVAEGYLLLDKARPDKKPDYLMCHNLLKLWKPAKEVILEMEDGNEPAELASVEHVLGELQMLDPDSTGWRYFETKEGEPTLKDPPNGLDLPNLNDVLGGVFSFLECVRMEIAHRLEVKAAIEAAYG